VIVRFLQRYASFFAILAGLVGYRLILPDNSSQWLELGTGLAITLATYTLLYKFGVTRIGGHEKTKKKDEAA
jgi:hypothetical protein